VSGMGKSARVFTPAGAYIGASRGGGRAKKRRGGDARA
jgi:hypothetical protein